MPPATLEGLRERGHEVAAVGDWGGGRRVQLVELLADGTMLAASDLRGEGHAGVY